jgi:hypothetical protein
MLNQPVRQRWEPVAFLMFYMTEEVMTEDKKNFLKQAQSFKLAEAVKQYVSEKNEPFASYERAIEWFTNTLKFHITKANVQTACESAEVNKAKLVLGGGSSVGGMTSRCFARLKELDDLVSNLQSRVTKIENDLK